MPNMQPPPRPPQYLVIFILLFGLVALMSFMRKDKPELAYSPTPTASPSPTKSPIAKNELSESDKMLWSSFCDEVKKGNSRGIYYTYGMNADTNDWESKQWCLTDSGTKTLRLISVQGVNGNIEQSFTPKTYVSEVYTKIVNGGVSIDPTIDEPTGDEMWDFGFGTCSSSNDLTVNYGAIHFAGWIVRMCDGPNTDLDDPKYFLTNLKGSYRPVFAEIAKIIPWGPTHLPKFSDFPVAVTHDEANFAGHYEMKTGLCRPECSLYIKDLATGKNFEEFRTHGFDFEFMPSSRLIIATGFRETLEGLYEKEYYLWDNDKLSLLYHTTVYYNEKYTFALVAPSDWIIGEEPAIHDGRSFNSPFGECQLRAYGVKTNIDRETFDKFLKNYLTDPYDSQENITMAGHKGVKRTSASSVWAYTQSGENYYALGLTCDEASQQQNYQVFDDALKTFEIN